MPLEVVHVLLHPAIMCSMVVRTRRLVVARPVLVLTLPVYRSCAVVLVVVDAVCVLVVPCVLVKITGVTALYRIVVVIAASRLGLVDR